MDQSFSFGTKALASSCPRYTDFKALWDSLRGGEIALLRGRWMVEQAHLYLRQLPRRQDLPEEALWDPEQLINRYENPMAGRRPPNLIVVSYCWLTKRHPDPDGFSMRKLMRILNWSHACPFRSNETAIFLDWCSLYQEPRTEQERKIFGNALRNYINVWYGHAKTDVLMLTEVPSDAESNRPYYERGWPTFEHRVSGLISQFRTIGESGVYDLGKLSSEHWEAECTPESWRGMHRTCVKGFCPPVTPQVFSKILSGKIFTNPDTDMDFCKRKYAEVFEETTAGAAELLYQGLEWGEKEAEELVDIFPNCRSLQVLNLRDNFLSDAGAGHLARALPSTLRHLNLRDNHIGDLGVEELADALTAGRCPSLRVINLSGNEFGDAGLELLAGALVCCQDLQFLHLAHNNFHGSGVLKLAGTVRQCPLLERLDLEGNAIDVGIADTLRWVWLKQGKVRERLVLSLPDQSSLETEALDSQDQVSASPNTSGSLSRLPMGRLRATLAMAAAAQRTFTQEAVSMGSLTTSQLGKSMSTSTLRRAFHASMVEHLDPEQAIQHVIAKLRDNSDAEGRVEAAKAVQLLARSPACQERLAEEQVLPLLLSLLTLPMTPLRAASAGAIRALVCGNAEIKRMAIHDGAVVMLAKQLESLHVELKENAALALASLSTGSKQGEFTQANAIPRLVGLLEIGGSSSSSSSSLVMQKAATEALKNLAPDTNAHASLINSGMVGALFSLLRRLEDCHVKGPALEGLKRLVEGCRDGCKDWVDLTGAFTAAQAFPVLVAFLRSSAAPEQAAALRILRKLTRHSSSCARQALAHGALKADALLATLDSPVPNLPPVALDVIWNLTGDAPRMLAIFGADLPRLLRSLRFREPEVRAEAARVLQEVVHDDNRAQAVELRAVESTVEVMMSTREDLQLPAVGLLRNLALHPDAKAVAHEAGAVSILSDLLCSRSAALQDMSARALRNLATNSDVKVTARDCGTIPTLVNLLASPFGEVQESAAGALRNLVYRNGDNRQVALRMKCFPPLLALLRSSLVAVQMQVLGAISNLVARSGDIELTKHIRQEALDAGVARELQPLVAHSDPRLRELALAACGALDIQQAQSSLHLPPMTHGPSWTTTYTRKAGCLGSPPTKATVHLPRRRSRVGS